jgi:hypothetical protein
LAAVEATQAVVVSLITQDEKKADCLGRQKILAIRGTSQNLREFQCLIDAAVVLYNIAWQLSAAVVVQRIM